MKSLFTLFLVATCLNLSAQWSNTTNLFTDSLHMPVCTATGIQQKSITIKSYPDSGYIIFWQDNRIAANQTDIYAQKYDKKGVAQWAANGIPVAAGTDDEQFAQASNADYRNYSYAVTDSAGGFFIAYQKTVRIGSYDRTGIAVQHLDAAGTAAYPGEGFMIAQPSTSDAINFTNPQLIADGKKGFFVSYVWSGGLIFVAAFRFTSNSFQRYATKLMNDDVYQISNPGACFIQHTFQFILPTVYDYQIWPDEQGGCNVIMNLNASTGGSSPQRLLAYNALKRVKKSCTTLTFRRTSDIANAKAITTEYQKDSIVRLYTLQTYSWLAECVTVVNTNYQIENLGLGYLIISTGEYDDYYAKGITAHTPGGNININAVAVSQRQLINSAATPFVTKMYTWPDEIYDSIPYQLTSNKQLYIAYNDSPPAGMNKMNYFRDTILNTASYFHDFSIGAASDKIYATARLPQVSTGQAAIYLQELNIDRMSADSFAVHYYNESAKNGTMIGRETSPGNSSYNTAYDNPMIATDDAGNALFYIREYYRGIRVSPIINGTQLVWGAMGSLLGTGIYNNASYTMDRPYATTYENGTGLICWDDQRYLNNNSADNIFMRHLDNLDVSDNLPPLKLITAITYPSALTVTSLLLGSSNAWSTIELQTAGTSTPVAQILDNYNLGAVDVFLYENNSAIRTFNGKPYLDRNYTIKPQNNPNGAATINVRLFFTTAEFNAFKAADPTIVDPSMLVVLKQPSGDISSAPAAYVPASGEAIIVPSSWQAAPGGYYLEISVKSFSNFFIEAANGALPITWLDVQAQWINGSEANITWQVADQLNVKDYTVQHSNDGSNFKNVCSVIASSATSYNCTSSANNTTKNYYRVMQQDIDGKTSYSKVVALTSADKPLLTLYPNPAKDKLYIRGGNLFSEATITDVNGKMISHASVNSSNQFIDISQLAKGIYFVKLTSGHDVHTLKFIKE